MYGLILAGGSGSRLWPLSRELCPKQLLALDGNDSLLQSTFKRLANIVPEKNIICVTNIKHANDVKFQISKLSKNLKLICEPVAKNTAPAIAVTLEYLKQKNEDDKLVLIAPSDLLIGDFDAYQKAIKDAEKLAKEGYIVTFGIKSSYPETAYGYVKVGEKRKTGYIVDKFVEKPDSQLAKSYIEDSSYYWNGGMFLAKVSVLLDELKSYCSDIYDNIKGFDFSQENKNVVSIPYSVFENIPEISIDYAVMEKSDKLAMVQLDCDWRDLGSWQSLYDVKEKDKKGNVIEGNVVADCVEDSLIYSSKKLVAASDIKDLIVVETEDAVMVCKKDQSQEVKKIYDKLKENNSNARMVHKTVFRPWGYYTCLAEGIGYLTKIISVSPKQKLSIQSHNHRSEHWVVLEGNALVVLEDEEHYLNPGQSIDIPVQAKHSLQNPYDEEVRIIEVQKGDYISEDDIIRYEDAYGRV